MSQMAKGKNGRQRSKKAASAPLHASLGLCIVYGVGSWDLQPLVDKELFKSTSMKKPASDITEVRQENHDLVLKTVRNVHIEQADKMRNAGL